MVLGDHGIKEQGTWQTIKVKAGSIEKLTLESQETNNIALSAKFDNLRAQLQAKDEAEVDLSRQTGDLSLYGISLVQTIECG